jgi:uncharacterized protein YjeT (DUF2065 family)
MLGTMLWRDLGAALALVLVFEGLIPLVSPHTAKRTAATVALLDAGVLRLIGALSIGVGLGILYLVRS